MTFYENDLKIVNFVKPYTLTTKERILTLIEATRYVLKNNINGDFIECGVWKGGSVMTMIKILQEYEIKKDVYLFDTFAGMTKPTDNDKNIENEKAEKYFDRTKINDASSNWCHVDLEEVKKHLQH